ncbi:hypothetical protein K8B33_01970 [Alcanivorax sp. JB21]|uniref:hypothetical protein n=1 Tax=Alcanivorax limicola TaxID=2874102 RepID=UPI001CBEC936|nr:hypothetical protein [Alcanivorax limicola]MBZ2187850.1 hypothetical protein [Alcanivorax limicola]
MFVFSDMDGWPLSAVLPPPEPIFDLLGLPVSLQSAVKLLESFHRLAGERPSDTTIHAIEKGKASKQSELQLMNYLPAFFLPDDKEIKDAQQFERTPFSRHSWKAVLRGVYHWAVPPELALLEDFVKDRIAKEEALHRELYGPTYLRWPRGDIFTSIGRQIAYPPSILDMLAAGEEAFCLALSEGRVSHEDQLKVILFFELDFIFGALKSLERGIISYRMRIDDNFKRRYPKMADYVAFSHFFPGYEDNDFYSPFERFLDLVRCGFSSEYKTWSALSNFIPVEGEQHLDPSAVKARRKDILKKWRSLGKKRGYMPSMEVMVGFIDNLSADDDEYRLLIIVAWAAMFLERAFTRHVEFAQGLDLPSAKASVLAEYRRYREP